MSESISNEVQFCELLADYREILGTIRLIRDAAGNESDDVNIADINHSMNLLARNMEDANKRLDKLYDIFNTVYFQE